MFDMGRSGASADRPEPYPAQSIGCSLIEAADAVRLSEQTRDWHFEFAQLKGGDFNASGAALDLDGVSVARLCINQTLLHRGYAPHEMIAVLMPGQGSGPAFAHGQLLEAGQCVALAEGAFLEAITHGRYIDVALGLNLDLCREQWIALNDGSLDLATHTTIAAPGLVWINDMVARVEWLLAIGMAHPELLRNAEARGVLADHILAAMMLFDGSPVDFDATTRASRAGRRIAVRLARDLIHSRLSDPLRLSQLCRHAGVGMRTLEYGFREVTGLTPVAYIRSLRLNAVRRALLRVDAGRNRSISEVAMDAGFWHLSQFAMDYRLFFGETPTETRRRTLQAARVSASVQPDDLQLA